MQLLQPGWLVTQEGRQMLPEDWLEIGRWRRRSMADGADSLSVVVACESVMMVAGVASCPGTVGYDKALPALRCCMHAALLGLRWL